jgi:hypothetical protein
MTGKEIEPHVHTFILITLSRSNALTLSRFDGAKSERVRVWVLTNTEGATKVAARLYVANTHLWDALDAWGQDVL